MKSLSPMIKQYYYIATQIANRTMPFLNSFTAFYTLIIKCNYNTNLEDKWYATHTTYV